MHQTGLQFFGRNFKKTTCHKKKASIHVHILLCMSIHIIPCVLSTIVMADLN